MIHRLPGLNDWCALCTITGLQEILCVFKARDALRVDLNPWVRADQHGDRRGTSPGRIPDVHVGRVRGDDDAQPSSLAGFATPGERVQHGRRATVAGV